MLKIAIMQIKVYLNLDHDSVGSATTEPDFIDDYNNEISDFDEFAEKYDASYVYSSMMAPVPSVDVTYDSSKYNDFEKNSFVLRPAFRKRDGFPKIFLSDADGNPIKYYCVTKLKEIRKFLNNKTLNLSTDNKVYFFESFNKLGFDRIIHQSRNLVNVKNYNYVKKSLTNLDNDSVKSITTEPTFIDDYDNEISDFDEYAEKLICVNTKH